jgi:hypothetical protein
MGAQQSATDDLEPTRISHTRPFSSDPQIGNARNNVVIYLIHSCWIARTRDDARVHAFITRGSQQYGTIRDSHMTLTQYMDLMRATERGSIEWQETISRASIVADSSAPQNRGSFPFVLEKPFRVITNCAHISSCSGNAKIIAFVALDVRDRYATDILRECLIDYISLSYQVTLDSLCIPRASRYVVIAGYSPPFTQPKEWRDIPLARCELIAHSIIKSRADSRAMIIFPRIFSTIESLRANEVAQCLFFADYYI